MTPFIEKLNTDMRLRNLSDRTMGTYRRFVLAFARAYGGRCPSELGAEEVRAFLLDLQDRGRSTSTRNVYWAALRFLYVETLGRPEVFATIPRVRVRVTREPTALTREEARRLLASATRPFDYTFFATLLATGLRISEACHLRFEDIDAAAGLIHVRRGKGGRPRSVKLSEKHLHLLRRYFVVERPPGPWLFPAQRLTAPGHLDPSDRWSDHPVSRDTMGDRFRRLEGQAALKRRVTPHDLRRTFASWLLDEGEDLRVVQVLLGHASPATTARYAAVSPDLIHRSPSPLDRL